VKRARVIAFWKPYGVLSQFTDPDGTGHATLAEFVPVQDVYAAGRLDHDSEGLLLLTDDGMLQHVLTDPECAHEKTYAVQVEGEPQAEALQRLREGVLVQGKRTLPAQVRRLESFVAPERVPPIRVRKTVPDCWLQLVLREGRNRQVRRMTAAVGHPTLRLLRVAQAGISLDGLRPGEWRALSDAEIMELRKLVADANPPARSGRAKSTVARRNTDRHRRSG
jgi:23S rRNA pseudouridine2457 synthase